MAVDNVGGGHDALKLAALGVLGENGEMPESYQSLQFHPNELTVVSANNFQDQTAFGAASPVKQYTGGKTRTLSAQFFFDTSDSGRDVRDKTKCVTDMLVRRGAAPAPPVCVFVYGAFMFVGTLESAVQKFLMFSREGRPVRATVDISLSEYKSMSGESFAAPPEAQRKIVTKAGGEELFHIAAREYGDPSKWRLIAEANGISNPRLVPEGTRLEINPV